MLKTLEIGQGNLLHSLHLSFGYCCSLTSSFISTYDVSVYIRTKQFSECFQPGRGFQSLSSCALRGREGRSVSLVLYKQVKSTVLSCFSFLVAVIWQAQVGLSDTLVEKENKMKRLFVICQGYIGFPQVLCKITSRNKPNMPFSSLLTQIQPQTSRFGTSLNELRLVYIFFSLFVVVSLFAHFVKGTIYFLVISLRFSAIQKYH